MARVTAAVAATARQPPTPTRQRSGPRTRCVTSAGVAPGPVPRRRSRLDSPRDGPGHASSDGSFHDVFTPFTHSAEYRSDMSRIPPSNAAYTTDDARDGWLLTAGESRGGGSESAPHGMRRRG